MEKKLLNRFIIVPCSLQIQINIEYIFVEYRSRIR
jgi:hypothetical protein